MIRAGFNHWYCISKNDDGYYTEKFITVNPFSNSSLSTILDNFNIRNTLGLGTSIFDELKK